MANSDIEVRDERMHDLFDEVTVTVIQGGFEFTEGAVWHAGRRELVFSDMAGDCMYCIDHAGKVSPYREPSNKANGNVLDGEGRLLTCEHATSRVVREEHDGSLKVLAESYDGKQLNSPNDIIVARDGTVLFSDPTYGRQEFYGIARPESQDERAVYAIDPDTSEVSRLCNGFDQPNGLCLSQDERYLYVNDTDQQIKRFTYADRKAGDAELFAVLTGDAPGNPDGMKIGSSGHLFCTGPGGLQVLTPDGTVLGVVHTPLPIANFNWGDDDLCTIYMCGQTTMLKVRTRVPGQRPPA